MTQRQSERGNIFFALFGAVALVGVVGAATTSLLRGPVSTVMSVNQKTKADTQMQIASKLMMVRSSQEANNGDCDMDGTVEPLAPEGTGGPAGGGFLPVSVGASQLDPWNTKYGYCAWDLGSTVGSGGCPGTRLAGGDNLIYPVMVIVSAGPDKVFQTSCEPWGAPISPPPSPAPANSATLINKLAGSDDIVLSFTYEEAVEAANGLWAIKEGKPDTITTDKNVEFSSGVQFSSAGQIGGQATFAQNSRLDLGLGGLFLLPTHNELPDGQCNAVNNGALRLNLRDYAPSTILEMCDQTIGFVALGGAGATVAKIDDLTDAKADTGKLALFLGDGAGLNYSSTSGADNNIGLGIGAASNLTGGDGNIVIGNGATLLTANTNSSMVIGHGIVGGIDGTLRLGNLLYGSNIYSSSGSLGIGAIPSATLDVNGNAEATRFQFDNSTYMGYGSGDIQWFTGGTQKMVLEAGGNLGIGVADPNVALDVNGDAEISGDVFADRFIADDDGSAASPSFRFGSAGSSGFYLGGSGTPYLGFSVGGVSEMTLDAGALTVNGDGLFDGFARATSFQFSSGQGMYQNGSGLTLNTGGGPQFYLDGFGKVGIGEASPATALDVGGAIKLGFVPDANCDAARAGSLRYASGDELQVCSSITGNFETIGTSGGGGGGSASYWTRISAVDLRLYYTAGFVGVGINDPQASLHNFGNFLNTGTFGAGLATPVSGAGTRMMFVPNKGAFRAGGVAGTQWDHANIGEYSTAFGYNAQAEGNYSVAMGSFTRAGGWGSLAAGADANAFGNSSIAMGTDVNVGDVGNITLGDRSIGIGLGAASGVNPTVTGNSSYGIFMGDQSGVNITTNNLMALLGGRMIIDPDTTSATNIVPSGLLTLDVQGDVGAIQYCDENGANCFTAGDISGGGVGIWEDASNVIRLTSGTVNYSSASFVFGSPSLNSTGVPGENTRMIFDKAKGAFRAGIASGTEWNTANLGNRSVAFGVNTIASGDNSFAVGAGASASGYGSTAIGSSSVASGSEAFALGLATRAEGNYAFAAGQDVRVTGANAMGLGLGGASGTDPVVGGASSFGIFMGDQSSVNFSSARTMGLFGGRMIIDPALPATSFATSGTLALDVQGQIGAMEYCDEDGLNCFDPADIGSAYGADGTIQFASGGKFWSSPTFLFSSASGGRIGVGTATPTQALHVVGSVRATQSLILDAVAGNAPSSMRLVDLGDTTITAASGGDILKYDSATGRWINAPGSSVSVSAAGNTTEIQFNSAGNFSASNMFTFNQGEVAIDGTTWSKPGVLRIKGAESPATNQLDATLILQSTAANTIWSQTLKSGAPGRNNDLVFAHYNGSTWIEPLTLATNGRIGIFSVTPAASFDINTNDAMVMPRGNDGQRPGTPVNGMIRYNNVSNKFEGYQNGSWQDILTGAATSTFLSLTDTPSSYATANGQFVRVNSGSTGLEFTDNVIGSVSGQPLPSFISLDDLSDVNLSVAPTNGQILSYNGTTWVAAAAPSGGGGTPAGSDRQIQFNSGGAFGAASGFVYSSSGAFMVSGTNTGTANSPVAGAGTRMFFDPGRAAFRAGTVTGANWNSANIGASSIAMGVDPMSSGNTSVSIGNTTWASGDYATAIGYAANATGTGAIALGTRTQAGNGTANAAGNYSAAIGLGLPTLSWPLVSGNNSMGVFMGAQDYVNITANNTVGFMGGKVIIDPKVPATVWTARATLDMGGANDAIILPAGLDATRPASPVNGMLRYNSASNKFEGYQGGSWQDILTGAATGTFLGLTDTPASYAGTAGQYVRVNAGTNALEFTDQIVGTVSGQPAPNFISLNDLSNVDMSVAPTGGQSLVYDSASSRWKAGTSAGGGTPAGATTQIQFNSAGAFGGSANFVWNNATNALSVTGKINVSDRISIAGTAGAAAPVGLSLANLTDIDFSVAPAGGQSLVYDSASSRWKAGTISGGGGGTPAGSTTQVQFNNAGAFGADSGMTYTTGALTLTGAATTALSATTSAASGRGVYGLASSGTGVAYGVFGQASNTNAGTAGVYGLANGGTAATSGVFGQSNSTTGTGVYGLVGGGSGLNYGVRGQTTSSLGIGVSGTSPFYGVAGSSTGNGGAGVVGSNNATGGIGVYGSSSDSTGFGVRGIVTSGSGTNYGVYGSATSASGFALYGAGNLHVTGNISYVGTLTDTSDMRLKTDIHPLRNRGSMLEKVVAIDTYSFRMKDEATRQIEFGVMAQELEKIFPELVKVDQSSPEKYMSVNYIGLITPLISATQELKAENDNLKAQLNTLETRLASMETDMKGMKVHTGYGIGRAEIGLWMVAGMGGFMMIFFFGGKIRRRFQKMN